MALRVLRGAYAYALQGFEYAGNTEGGQVGETKQVKAGLARDVQREWGEPRPLWALPLSNPDAFRFPWPALPEPNLYSGYYPYSETGTMRFKADNTLEIVFWTNVAGYSFFTGANNPPLQGVSSFRPDLQSQHG